MPKSYAKASGLPFPQFMKWARREARRRTTDPERILWHLVMFLKWEYEEQGMARVRKRADRYLRKRDAKLMGPDFEDDFERVWTKVESSPPGLLLERALERAERHPLDVPSTHSERWQRFVSAVGWQCHLTNCTDVVLAQVALAQVHGARQPTVSAWIEWGVKELGWVKLRKASYGKWSRASLYRIDVSEWEEVEAAQPRQEERVVMKDGHKGRTVVSHRASRARSQLETDEDFVKELLGEDD